MINRRHDRGSAILIAMFILVMLAGMGIALLFLTDSEVKLSRSSVRSKQAFYLAEAAVEGTRLDLFATQKNDPFDSVLDTAAGVNDTRDFDPDALRRSYDSGGAPNGLSGFFDDVPLTSLTAFGAAQGVEGWYATFVTNDPTEIDLLTDSNDRVMLTGVGMGPGGSFEIVQTIIEQRGYVPPLPPAAITLAGPTPDYVSGSSNSMDYVGTDCNGAGDPSVEVPTIGSWGTSARDLVVANMGKDVYSSGALTGADTMVDLTDTSNPLLAGGVDPAWSDCAGLVEMMRILRYSADVVCTGPGCVLPPPSPSRVVFVEGDYLAMDGQGILAVTGRLDVELAWDWDGLILVIGKGQVFRSGGGNGEIQGSIFVADVAGPDEQLFTSDDCSAAPDGFDQVSFQTSGGGTSVVSYCKANLDAIQVPLPYAVVDFRQR
jgi:hypothetical protein